MSTFIQHTSRWIVIAMVSLVVVLAAMFREMALEDPATNYLDGRGPAEWILYPKPPDGGTHRAADLETLFRKTFDVGATPGKAVLIVRGMKQWTVAINGTAVEGLSGPIGSWKEEAVVDISRLLRPGPNEIAAKVLNTNGPPALWLILQLGDSTVVSGTNWDASLAGAAWRKATTATEPMVYGPGNALEGGERVAASFGKRLPTLLIFAAAAAGMFFWGKRWFARKNAGAPAGWTESRKFAALAVGVPAILWAALFCNNVGLLPAEMGFDSIHHIAYIDYVRSHWRLPLANEAWQAYQPPLYYLICAVLSAPLQWVGSGASVMVLARTFGLAVGIAHFALVFLSLRLLFPGRIGPQLWGLVLAAFIPENLYISQFVTNEGLAATLVTAALYLCLRIVKEDSDSPWLFGVMGLCIGAALLAKVTGIIAVPVIGATLVIRLMLKKERVPRVWLRTVGLSVVVALAVCGWHYARVWAHFGKPLVGNWDVSTGFYWWMERGYDTAGYFFKFGRWLVYPWFSGFDSFGDGLYSTLWGDSLWGGEVFRIYRPPWNYELMAAGFLLALWPTAMILGGAAGAVWRFVRKPALEWFPLIGIAFSMIAALVYMALKVPNYAEAKAFYGLIALMPMCAFAALGWEWVMRRGKLAVAIGSGILGVWAMTSYASFWVRRWSPDTQVVVARLFEAHHDKASADAHYAKALRLDPANIEARKRLAKNSFDLQKFDETKQLIEAVLQVAPGDAESHAILASILAARNDLDGAVAEAEKGTRLAPDQSKGYIQQGDFLKRQGRAPEAVAAWREGLRANPLDAELHYRVAMASLGTQGQQEAFAHFRLASQLKPDWAEAREQYGLTLLSLNRFAEALEQFGPAAEMNPGDASYHYNLAVALGAVGMTADAVKEYGWALRLNPDYLQALNNLAWVLATSGDARVRNGAEAVKLAERACRLTERKKAVFIGTLAAAYAEAGRFADAIAAAKEAITKARDAGEQSVASGNEKLLEVYQSNRAYHQQPPATGR